MGGTPSAVLRVSKGTAAEGQSETLDVTLLGREWWSLPSIHLIKYVTVEWLQDNVILGIQILMKTQGNHHYKLCE